MRLLPNTPVASTWKDWSIDVANRLPGETSEPEVPLGTRNCRTREYRTSYSKLPRSVQEIADKKFRLFVENSHHPSLRLHKLKPHGPSHRLVDRLSVSVTRNYRALFWVDGQVNVWYWIGTHAEYDRLTG